MRVLMVTPELAPMVKQGGIGEGIAALTHELRGLGNRVTALLPFHRDLQGHDLRPRPGHDAGGFRVLEGTLGNGLDVIVIDAKGLSERHEIYGNDIGDADNARRFGLFSRAVVDVVRDLAQRGDPIDVVHTHEWPCAVVPYLIRQRPELAQTRTVLTIHNLAHQGIFPVSETLDALGLGHEHAGDDRLGFRGHVNLMKGGIMAADAITTVSPTYAREIQESRFGELLHEDLRRRAAQLSGLLNGIDYVLWNPRRDPAIAAPYDADDRSGKATCKAALVRELGLEERGRPLLVSLGRVVPQKGSDLLAASLEDIVKCGIDVVVAGGGDADLVSALTSAVGRVERSAARYLGVVSDDLVHRLMAGADLVAMPSRFEPCGIVQMYALRYGAIPVAANTGGLADSIEDGKTGFLYDEPTAGGLVEAVRRAHAAMLGPAWPHIQERAMRAENSWKRRAFGYHGVYRRAAARR